MQFWSILTTHPPPPSTRLFGSFHHKSRSGLGFSKSVPINTIIIFPYAFLIILFVFPLSLSVTMKLSCSFDVTRFPVDQHTCYFRMGPLFLPKSVYKIREPLCILLQSQPPLLRLFMVILLGRAVF